MRTKSAQGRWPDVRPPRFRRLPFVRDDVCNPGRASAPRIAAPHMLPSTSHTASAPAMLCLSEINGTPHTIAVYASQPPSPTATVAVGTVIAHRPPHRSRRAAFPHRAPAEGRTRPEVLDTPDPSDRDFSDVPVPVLRPGHASSLTIPSTGRLPSTVSATAVTRRCSRFHRYYAAVRPLTCSPTASSPRLPVAARDRCSDCGPDEVSQVPTRSLPT